MTPPGTIILGTAAAVPPPAFTMPRGAAGSVVPLPLSGLYGTLPTLLPPRDGWPRWSDPPSVMTPGQRMMHAGEARGFVDVSRIESLARAYEAHMLRAAASSGAIRSAAFDRALVALASIGRLAPDIAPEFYADAIDRMGATGHTMRASILAEDLWRQYPLSRAALRVAQMSRLQRQDGISFGPFVAFGGVASNAHGLLFRSGAVSVPGGVGGYGAAVLIFPDAAPASGTGSLTRDLRLRYDIDAPRAAILAYLLKWKRLITLEFTALDGSWRASDINEDEHLWVRGLARLGLRAGDWIRVSADGPGAALLLDRIEMFNSLGWYSDAVVRPDVLRTVRLEARDQNASLAAVAFDMMRNLHEDRLNAVYDPASGTFVIGGPLLWPEDLEAELGAGAPPAIELSLDNRGDVLSVNIGSMRMTWNSKAEYSDAVAEFRQEFAILLAGMPIGVAMARQAGGLPGRVDRASLIMSAVDPHDGKALEIDVHLMMDQLGTDDLSGAYIPGTGALYIGDPRLDPHEIAARYGARPQARIVRLHLSRDGDVIRIIPADGAAGFYLLDPQSDQSAVFDGMAIYR